MSSGKFSSLGPVIRLFWRERRGGLMAGAALSAATVLAGAASGERPPPGLLDRPPSGGRGTPSTSPGLEDDSAAKPRLRSSGSAACCSPSRMIFPWLSRCTGPCSCLALFAAAQAAFASESLLASILAATAFKSGRDELELSPNPSRARSAFSRLLAARSRSAAFASAFELLTARRGGRKPQ